VAWVKLGSDGVNASPVVKNAGAAAIDAVARHSGAQTGDTIFLMGGKKDSVLDWMGALRLELARREKWIPENQMEHALGDRLSVAGI